MRPQCNFLRRSLFFCVATAALSTTAAFAQDSGVPDEEEDSIQDIIVVKGVRASLAEALDTKRDAGGFVDALVAQDIADFPDLNLTESLQRVPGVSVFRDRGEGQFITVRSLAPQFTQVRVNDQTLTSPGGRDVELDIFASELVQNVLIRKTPNASLTEGGLAATVDIKTRRPFTTPGFVVADSAQGRYNSLVKDLDPQASLVVSNTFGDQFGALFSAAYSDYGLREDFAEDISTNVVTFFDGSDTGPLIALEAPRLPRIGVNETQRERIGITGALQFRPAAHLEFVLDIAHAKFTDDNARHSADVSFGNNATNVLIAPNTVPGEFGVDRLLGGTIGNVRARSENRFDTLQDNLTTINLESDWAISRTLSAHFQIGYSDASQTNDRYSNTGTFDGATVEVGRADLFGRPVTTFTSNDFSYTNPADFALGAFDVRRFLADDEEFSVKSDLIYNVDFAVFSTIQFGVRYSDRSFEVEGFRDSFSDDTLTFADVAFVGNFDIFGSNRPGNLPSDFLILTPGSVAAASNVVPSGFNRTPVLGQTFSVDEDTFAGYIMSEIDGALGSLPVGGDIGVRIVNTQVNTLGI